jgi:hypothetical protein
VLLMLPLRLLLLLLLLLLQVVGNQPALRNVPSRRVLSTDQADLPVSGTLSTKAAAH